MSSINRLRNLGSSNINYDYVDLEQTSSTVETYRFYSGEKANPNRKLRLTIIITYTAADKETIDDVDFQRED